MRGRAYRRHHQQRMKKRVASYYDGVFRGDQEARLIDVNCDGRVNVQDATAFGTNWNAGWANTVLPTQP